MTRELILLEARLESLIRFLEDLVKYSQTDSKLPEYEGMLELLRLSSAQDDFPKEVWSKFSPFMENAPGDEYGVSLLK
jgi:hypothetical protein